VEHADPDLQEPGPVPWRRVYGFAILAQGYLYTNPGLLVVQYGWLAVTYLSGQLDRKDETGGPHLGRFNFIKYPLFALGLTGLAGWLLTIRSNVEANLAVIFSNPLQIILSCVITPIVATVVILWQTKHGRTTMV